jgi:protein O-mannosyl-transferase
MVRTINRTQSRRWGRARRNEEDQRLRPRGLSRGWRNALFCFGLAIATFGVYSPVRAHPFVAFDDQEYVVDNPHVQHGIDWAVVKWGFTANRSANWHPLTWLSHAIDYRLFGLDAGGHHLDSLVLHVLNAVLLFLLLELWTGLAGPSLLVAALFALHPLNVESVAWVAERKNVLSTLFFLLAIGAYGWYARKPNWRRYWLVALLFAMGLMAKPMVITLPFVLLLLDYWPLGRYSGGAAPRLDIPQTTVGKLVLEKVPLLFLSAASAVITMKAQVLTEGSLLDYPLWVRMENALVAYALYLWKMVWPVGLAAMYPHPGRSLHSWQIVLSAVVLAGISALVVIQRSRGYLVTGWLWFLGTLIPVIGLVQVGYAAMADRYAYVPLIGIFIMVAFGARDLAEAKHIRMGYRTAVATGVLAALSLLSYRQIGYWSSEYDLWAHALEVTSGNVFAHNAIGSALLAPEMWMSAADVEGFDTRKRQMGEARRHYERALEICRQHEKQDPGIYLPAMANTLDYLGDLDRLQRRMDDARRRYNEALEIHRQLVRRDPQGDLPYLAKTINDLGMMDRLENHPEEARAHFLDALENFRQLRGAGAREYLPDVALTLTNLAKTAEDEQRADEANGYFEQALQVRRQLAQQEPAVYLPDLAANLEDLGAFNFDRQRFEAAQRYYEEALGVYRGLARDDPEKFLSFLADVLDNLAMVESHSSQVDPARSHYGEALAIYRKLEQENAGRFSLYVQQVEQSMAQLNAQASAK